MDNNANRRPYRSIFWPLVLIAGGVLALLWNLGIIPSANFFVLLNLWPLLLVAAGLDILFGRRWPLIGALINIVIVGLAVALVIYAPRLGLTRNSGGWMWPGWNNEPVKTERISTPMGDASAAQITLELSSYPTTLQALSDSPNLIDANIAYRGQLDFSVSGESEKRVRLRQIGGFEPWFWGDFNDAEQPKWEIGLSPRVPTNLNVDIGSGSAQLDLSQLQLTGLTLNGGSGSLNATLPTDSPRYTANIDIGSGSFELNVPENADVEIKFQGGSGSTNMRLPETAAVRVEVLDKGSGSLNLPGRLSRVQSGHDEAEGIWESPDFAQAEKQIVITLDTGSGSVNIHG